METDIILYDEFLDNRGFLISLESNKNVPFDIKRVFYIYGVPGDVRRGGHAHKKCHQLLTAVKGNVIVRTDPDGKEWLLLSPDYGLYVPPGVDIVMHTFSPDAVLMVLASELYDKHDYIFP